MRQDTEGARGVDNAGSGAPTHSARGSHLFFTAGATWITIQAFGLLGDAAEISFVLVGLATLIATIVGARRPGAPRGAWALVIGAFTVWNIGGALRESAQTLGDLSTTRTLVPDAFSMTGYILLAAGMSSLLRAAGDRKRQIDVALDTSIVILAAAAGSWVFFVGPTFANVHAPTLVTLLLVLYPALSLGVATVVVRVLFGSEGFAGTAGKSLLGSMFMLLIGDLWYMAIELGFADPPQHLRDIPYVAAFLLFGTAVLHPGIMQLTNPTTATPPDTNARVRVISVALALGLPSVAVFTGAAATDSDRIALGTLSAGLTLASTIRLTRAIRDQGAIQDAIAHLASHDPLTDLPNRESVLDHLGGTLHTALRSSSLVGTISIGIDDFPTITDGLGRDASDALLRAVSRRLDDLTPADVVGRVGFDEFVVVTTAASIGDIRAMADRLQASFVVPFSMAGVPVHLSASVGCNITSPDQPAATWGSQLDDSIAALHQARHAGGDRVEHFRHELRSTVTRRVQLGQDLRQALQRKELFVAYQPLVSLPEHRVIGFEALARWEHPTLGRVDPEEFIPLAEDSGVISELGRFILDESLAQMARWRADYTAEHCKMSVNVSPRAFEGGDVVDMVEQSLLVHGIDAGSLQLEITESLLIGDPGSATLALQTLRDRGVTVAVDDFGTGYSSLAHLRRFPVDMVKIDRSFVSTIGHRFGGSDESLVSAIVAMADALGLSTLAEGIETGVQATRLAALGVRAGQGYLFGHAAPAADVEMLLHPRTEGLIAPPAQQYRRK